MQRIRSKKTVIDVEANKEVAPAMQSSKIPIASTKVALPIGPHKKEKEKTGKEVVINV